MTFTNKVSKAPKSVFKTYFAKFKQFKITHVSMPPTDCQIIHETGRLSNGKVTSFFVVLDRSVALVQFETIITPHNCNKFL